MQELDSSELKINQTQLEYATVNFGNRRSEVGVHTRVSAIVWCGEGARHGADSEENNRQCIHFEGLIGLRLIALISCDTIAWTQTTALNDFSIDALGFYSEILSTISSEISKSSSILVGESNKTPLSTIIINICDCWPMVIDFCSVSRFWRYASNSTSYVPLESSTRRSVLLNAVRFCWCSYGLLCRVEFFTPAKWVYGRWWALNFTRYAHIS